MVENTTGEATTRARKPRATAVVCAKFPMAIPSAVGMPVLAPYTIRMLSTNKLSGPGSRVRLTDANKNEIKTPSSDFTLSPVDIIWVEFYGNTHATAL